MPGCSHGSFTTEGLVLGHCQGRCWLELHKGHSVDMALFPGGFQSKNKNLPRVCRGPSPWQLGCCSAVMAGRGLRAGHRLRPPRWSRQPPRSGAQMGSEGLGEQPPSKAIGTDPATLRVPFTPLSFPQQASWASILTRHHWF